MIYLLGPVFCRDVVALLLAHEASCNVQDGKGSTPLHLAAWAGHTEVVRTLLHQGPSVSNVNHQVTCHSSPHPCMPGVSLIRLFIISPNTHSLSHLTHSLTCLHSLILSLIPSYPYANFFIPRHSLPSPTYIPPHPYTFSHNLTLIPSHLNSRFLTPHTLTSSPCSSYTHSLTLYTITLTHPHPMTPSHRHRLLALTHLSLTDTVTLVLTSAPSSFPPHSFTE